MIIQKYKHPILFYGLSIAIPWMFWFGAAWFSHRNLSFEYQAFVSGILSLLGLLAPLFVALFLILPNRELRRDCHQRIFHFQDIDPNYLYLTAFLILTSILLAQFISLLCGYSVDQFQLRGGYSFSSGVLPVWLLLFVAPLIEELAWHSYGTDCLRSRFNLFTTSVLFALFWGFWHFPLSFIKDYYHSNLVESGWIYSLNFILSLFPFVIIMNWLYYKTNRNILVTVVFHISAVYFNEIFATHPMSKVIQTGLLLLLSIYLLVKDRALFFEFKKMQ